MESDGDTWAMTHTNLGLALLECARFKSGSEFVWQDGGETESADAYVAEAISHFDIALRWRSYERDTGDWAYTQANLGVAYRQLITGDVRHNVRRALEHYLEAERGYA